MYLDRNGLIFKNVFQKHNISDTYIFVRNIKTICYYDKFVCYYKLAFKKRY